MLGQNCVRCGYCCKQAPCSYGTWDPERKRCRFLQDYGGPGGVTLYNCGKYAEIMKREKDTKFPMFGCGCSSTVLNTDRDAVVRAVTDLLLRGIRGKGLDDA